MTGLDDHRFIRRIERRAGADYDPAAWPYTLAPVAQLLTEGLELAAGVTFLVGENGSGKSTLVEAVAAAAGLNPEGGSRHALHSTRVSESPLAGVLQLIRSGSGPVWSYFLRAETMHGLYTYLEGLPDAPGPRLHEMSHGESFLQVLTQHFDTPGLYLLDEPESALSFSSCLGLIRVLHDLSQAGGQVLCATHSPLLTALPGATILQVGPDGLTPTSWDELELTAHWRRFLAAPQAYLRHLL